jgi:hypothetical protein
LEDILTCIATDRRMVTGQAVACWFVFTLAVIKLCCYRTFKLHLPAVEFDYKVMKGIVVLLKLSVVPTADCNVTVKSEEFFSTTDLLKL